MELTIRTEKKSDYPEVEELIESAFANEEMSDHSEHLLVSRLRKSSNFSQELSLIAKTNDKIIGHVILTPICIESANESFASLALAPISVLPEYQRRGIGSKLMREAHLRAHKNGHSSIILVGHEAYYPRFDYVKLCHFDISLPFEAPSENCFAIELIKGSLKGVSGIVKYPIEFEL